MQCGTDMKEVAAKDAGYEIASSFRRAVLEWEGTAKTVVVEGLQESFTASLNALHQKMTPAKIMVNRLIGLHKAAAKAKLDQTMKTLQPIAGGRSDGVKWCAGFKGDWPELVTLAGQTVLKANPKMLLEARDAMNEADKQTHTSSFWLLRKSCLNIWPIIWERLNR
eukprot:924030-Amphidinium_carterae.1